MILRQAETDGIHGSAQTGNLGHILLVAVVFRGILADDRIHCIRISLDGFRHAVLVAGTVVEIIMCAIGPHITRHGTLQPVIPVCRFRLGAEVIVLERCAVGHEDDKQIPLFPSLSILSQDRCTQLVDSIEGVVVVCAAGCGNALNHRRGLIGCHKGVGVQPIGTGIDLSSIRARTCRCAAQMVD